MISTSTTETGNAKLLKAVRQKNNDRKLIKPTKPIHPRLYVIAPISSNLVLDRLMPSNSRSSNSRSSNSHSKDRVTPSDKASSNSSIDRNFHLVPRISNRDSSGKLYPSSRRTRNS